MTLINQIRKHPAVSITAGVILLFIIVLGTRAIFRKPAVVTNNGLTRVSLVNAANFRRGNMNITTNGVVESQSQADLKTQVSGPIVAVNVGVGDPVYAGQVLVELSNADIRAQLAQAQAGLAAAQGQQYTGSISVESSKQGAIDKIRDAYVKAYDIVNGQVDPILYNNDGNGGRLQPYITDEKLVTKIVDTRIDLNTTFPSWKTTLDSLSIDMSTADLVGALGQSQKNLAQVDSLLAAVSQVLNDSAKSATPTFAGSIGGWKTTISTARGVISAASQSLTTAQTTLSTGNASQNTTASAGVSAAQAGVNNLEAQLAKTLIVSPIDGRVASLPLRAGELALPGTLVATVVGDTSNLLVKARVSGEDLPRLAVGQAALIQGRVKGLVANVAPSVDFLTKKAEVDIAVTEGGEGLVVGQNVGINISTGTSTVATDGPVTYILPIQDVKIIPGDAFVFTVDKNSKIKRVPVTLGSIQGDYIEVVSGLSDSLDIVTPVYELDEGQSVIVQ